MEHTWNGIFFDGKLNEIYLKNNFDSLKNFSYTNRLNSWETRRLGTWKRWSRCGEHDGLYKKCQFTTNLMEHFFGICKKLVLKKINTKTYKTRSGSHGAAQVATQLVVETLPGRFTGEVRAATAAVRVGLEVPAVGRVGHVTAGHRRHAVAAQRADVTLGSFHNWKMVLFEV